MEQSLLAVAETAYRDRGVAVALRAATQNAKALGRRLIIGDTVATAPVVHVRVNHGRWLVDCPFCNGAQVASLADHRFLCADCFNASAQGQPLAVVWPNEAERAAIEAEMLRRPEVNRNWLPGETIADLISEREAIPSEASSAVETPLAALLARIETLEAQFEGRMSG